MILYKLLEIIFFQCLNHIIWILIIYIIIWICFQENPSSGCHWWHEDKKISEMVPRELLRAKTENKDEIEIQIWHGPAVVNVMCLNLNIYSKHSTRCHEKDAENKNNSSESFNNFIKPIWTVMGHKIFCRNELSYNLIFLALVIRYLFPTEILIFFFHREYWHT